MPIGCNTVGRDATSTGASPARRIGQIVVMAKQTGRQRFDFSDADVTIYSASNGNGASPSSGGDEQLVRLVDDQFKDLMDGIKNGGSRVGIQVVELTSPQFTGLFNAIKTGGGGGGPKPGPNPLGLREIHVVELVDNQFKGLMDAITGTKGQGGRAGVPNPNNVPNNPRGPDGFWENIRNLFRRGQSITNRSGIGRTARLKTRRLGMSLRKKGKALSAGGGAFGKAAGGVAQFAGGALLRAAGPVGIAVSAVSAALDAVTDVFKATTAAVKFFGEAAIKVAKNDGIGLLASGFNAAADAVGKIPVLGKVFAAGLELASAGLTTFKAVLDAFTARGRELAKYNPRIALAAAQADVRKIFADIREANQNAGKYADLITQSQRLDESFQKALQPLKEAVMKILIKFGPLLEYTATGLGAIVGKWVGVTKTPAEIAIEQASDNLAEGMAKGTKEQVAALKLILEALQKQNEDPANGASVLQGMVDIARNLPLEPGGPPPKGNVKDALRFPLPV